MTTPIDQPVSAQGDQSTRAPGDGPVNDAAGGVTSRGVWLIVPTYNEADNLAGISAAILDALPAATLLVVDDGSPDGTGHLADELAAGDARIRVLHRPAKQGLGGRISMDFGVALGGGAGIVVQMDADWSHDPSALPSCWTGRSLAGQAADLVIGSRYTPAGGPVDWGVGRRLISRGGSLVSPAWSCG